MVILYASDIHVDVAHLDRLLVLAGRIEADAVVIGGDLIPVRGRTLAESIEPQKEWVRGVLLPRLAGFRRKYPHTALCFDFGNDDFLAARELLTERDGEDYMLIHNRVVPLGEKLALVGYMCVPPTPFRIKDWEKIDCPDRSGIVDRTRRMGSRTGTGVETSYKLKFSHGTIQEDLDAMSRLMDEPRWQDHSFVLVAHSPPSDTALDRIMDGTNVGSLAIRRFIERWAPTGRLLVTLHGHIHEAPRMSGRVWDTVAGVPCFNVGQEPGGLRALAIDPGDIVASARVIVFRDGGVMVEAVKECAF